MGARFAFCLVGAALVASACGGRLIESGNDYGGSPGSGASSGVGGTPHAGATAGMGGAKPHGGRSGSGGASSAGGAVSMAGAPAGGAAGAPAAGGGCACPLIDCAPGYQLVPNADGCCAHCELRCGSMSCPGLACASGSHLELLSGWCCPTCVQDYCQQERDGYQSIRQALIEKYSSVGCMIDRDCSVYYDKNECAVGCGVVVPAAVLNDLDANLRGYASTTCGPECRPSAPACEPQASPICFHGRCE